MGKIALITGASGGIGAEIARSLNRDGFTTLLHYNRSKDKITALSEELGGSETFRADFEKSEEIEDMFKKIKTRHGGVDLLVNNAGLASYGLFTDINPTEWRRLFAVNVDAIYHCCRLAIPHMVHNKYGKIINVSSIWGICGASCEAAYSSAKSAVIGLTKALAKELGPSNITVNCVAPGAIMTDMLTSLSSEALELLKEETPLGRLGTPSDIAALVAFLASSRADFITGQVISPNGGFVI
ncbi:MAG TPA: 3-oxoacyl-ACP reductase FabG [Clostridiales bacterium]|jgi:3-oxoacyl-[acyl-carrier protein] reductase|nr:3-oxoacyl-ACP reductase FabG [Clostridiales bacterium]